MGVAPEYRSRTGLSVVIDTNALDGPSVAMAALRHRHKDGWIKPDPDGRDGHGVGDG
jgi:hypothetical protein